MVVTSDFDTNVTKYDKQVAYINFCSVVFQFLRGQTDDRPKKHTDRQD